MTFQNDLNKQLNEIGGTSVSSVIPKLITMAKTFGGKIYLVGGAVRDELLGKEAKDYDFLITKITLPELAKKLQAVLPGAKINEVGQSFGVIKMSFGDDEFDFAIPRADVDRENVKTDPNIPVEEDLMRRDFSIGAMAKDLETGEIINAPGVDGQSDLKQGIIRAVGNAEARFSEDPLRMLRAIQFSARFGFTIAPDTLKAIKENVDLLEGVSADRFYEEFNKAWTKGNADAEVFFNLLEQTRLGVVMFGQDFNPIAIDNKKFVGHKRFLSQCIAAFLNGGDYTKVILKTDEQDMIKVARWFKQTIDKGLDYNSIKSVAKFGHYFPIIRDTFIVIDDRSVGPLSTGICKLLEKPLIPKIQGDKQESWELPITGGELIEFAKELGIELKGKMISEITLKLIQAYQEDKLSVSNNQKDDKDRVQNALKTLLNENIVKDATRLEILTKRMNNILYK